MLKKSASGVPSLRRSGFAQAGRPLVVLTYSVYAPLAKSPLAWPEERCVLANPGWAGETTARFEHFPLRTMIL
ncbi:MAG: hypothetical protein V3U07_04245 [Nitrospirales bacterium]